MAHGTLSSPAGSSSSRHTRRRSPLSSSSSPSLSGRPRQSSSPDAESAMDDSLSCQSSNARTSRVRVAVACMPCVKAKTRCAPVRPCPRCVRLNRAHLCQDRSVYRQHVKGSKIGSPSPLSRETRSPECLSDRLAGRGSCSQSSSPSAEHVDSRSASCSARSGSSDSTPAGAAERVHSASPTNLPLSPVDGNSILESLARLQPSPGLQTDPLTRQHPSSSAGARVPDRFARLINARYPDESFHTRLANLVLDALEHELAMPAARDQWPDDAVDVVLGWAWNLANRNGQVDPNDRLGLASREFVSRERGTAFTMSEYEVRAVDTQSAESLQARERFVTLLDKNSDAAGTPIDVSRQELQMAASQLYSGRFCSPPLDNGLASQNAPSWELPALADEGSKGLGLGLGEAPPVAAAVVSPAAAAAAGPPITRANMSVDLPVPMYHQTLVRLDNSRQPVRFRWKLEVNDAWSRVLGYSAEVVAQLLSGEDQWARWFFPSDLSTVARFMVSTFRRRPTLAHEDTTSFATPLFLRSAKGVPVYGLLSIKLLYVKWRGVLFAHSVAMCFSPLPEPRAIMFGAHGAAVGSSHWQQQPPMYNHGAAGAEPSGAVPLAPGELAAAALHRQQHR